jgi:hypothetical protein
VLDDGFRFRLPLRGSPGFTPEFPLDRLDESRRTSNGPQHIGLNENVNTRSGGSCRGPNRLSSDGKEDVTIGLREVTVDFGTISRAWQSGPVELIGKKTDGVPEVERWQHDPMRNGQSSETAAGEASRFSNAEIRPDNILAISSKLALESRALLA